MRWERIDFAAAVVTIRASIAEVNGQNWEKDTKDHQQRRIVLDPQTLGLLRALLVLRAQEAEALGFELPEDGFVFSPDVDGAIWPKPATMTRRLTRMCEGLGYDIHLHQLRHYSATELISGGVDVRASPAASGTEEAVSPRCATERRGSPKLISAHLVPSLTEFRSYRVRSPRTARRSWSRRHRQPLPRTRPLRPTGASPLTSEERSASALCDTATSCPP
ncbi:hypothetical protein [Actinomycetospora sp. NBC_00405]|uniref:hypothetical protein n=1 Tax=Actinomycetospora sp. NBC_00405 TaxID=2975952 RepID=UPI002E1A0F25